MNIKSIVIGTVLTTSCAYANEDCNFTKLSENRHSGYSFDSTKSITKEQIIKLAEAASLAPSSYNEQPWRFIFCDKMLSPKAYEKAFRCLVEANQKWAKDVPLLIVVLADNKSDYNQKINTFAAFDTGAAALSLVYQATDLGLMAHQMGGYEVDKLKEAFAIPENLIPLSVIAIGYEKHNESIQPKKRRPLGESFFLGELNKKLIN
jgi:nitroreductase